MKQDRRELCLLHANCQGEPLSLLLNESQEFAARWRIQQYTNYTHEAIPESAPREASLFLYQYLGPGWSELSSDVLLGKLGPQAVPVCIPNLFFKGYWPAWTSDSPMDFGDVLLDRLYLSGAGKEAILRVYLRGKLEKLVDIGEAADESLRQEARKEERCDVKTQSFVAERWKTERLFQTVNHPDAPLLIHVAQGILSFLGLPPLSAAACGAFSYDYEGFSLPIHPQVGDFHSLPFAREETAYPVFGKNMTFAQYCERYIDCRLRNMEDCFLGYLQTP